MTTAMAQAFSDSSITSPGEQRRRDVEALAVHFTWPWLTIWRATNGVQASLAR